MGEPHSESIVRFRIVVDAPPEGVRFAVQRGKSELLEPSHSGGQSIRFEFLLRVRAAKDGGFNFLGEYAQGSPADRFIYLNSGTYAGQPQTCWSRRAKLGLASIPPGIVDAAIADPRRAIEARVKGTGRDGGPICASLKQEALEWRIA